MHPIHKEKYILTKEAYGQFNIDQNKAKIEKNRNNAKITSVIQIVVGIIFLVAMFVTKQQGVFVFSIMAVILVVVGAINFKKRPLKYDQQLQESLDRSYENGRYGECYFDVKFYEDKMTYLVGGNSQELSYNEFLQFFETEKYFGIHFMTGDVVIFNPDCDKAKIKEIIKTARTKGEIEAENAQNAVEDIMDTAIEDIAEEIL